MAVGRVRQVVVLCSINSIKYYLSRLASGCYGEVVFKRGLTVLKNFMSVVASVNLNLPSMYNA